MSRLTEKAAGRLKTRLKQQIKVISTGCQASREPTD